MKEGTGLVGKQVKNKKQHLALKGLGIPILACALFILFLYALAIVVRILVI